MLVVCDLVGGDNGSRATGEPSESQRRATGEPTEEPTKLFLATGISRRKHTKESQKRIVMKQEIGDADCVADDGRRTIGDLLRFEANYEIIDMKSY